MATDKPQEPLKEQLIQSPLVPLTDRQVDALATITDADIAAAIADAKKNHPELYDLLTATSG